MWKAAKAQVKADRQKRHFRNQNKAKWKQKMLTAPGEKEEDGEGKLVAN